MSEKRTCLYDKHVKLGAKMVPFGGFEMPIQYTGIEDEHNAVRHACGVFDVSHMGELLLRGPQSRAFSGQSPRVRRQTRPGTGGTARRNPGPCPHAGRPGRHTKRQVSR